MLCETSSLHIIEALFLITVIHTQNVTPTVALLTNYVPVTNNLLCYESIL